MERKKRIGVASLLVFLSLSVVGWVAYRAIRQERLDRQLIAAIKQNQWAQSRVPEVLACLKRGADPNARDEAGPERLSWDRLLRLFGVRKTPAQTALLMELEGDYQFGYMFGKPFRHWSWGDAKIVKVLLQYGADTSIRDKHGRTALAAAFSPIPIDNQGDSLAPLWDKRCELLLLEAGANVEDRDQNGRTAIMAHNITERGGEQVAEALIRKGANVNASSRDGKTALIYRAIDGKESDCLLLLNHGADVNHADSKGYTALICATNCGKDGIVDTLLKHGANVNANQGHGKTALIMAVTGKHTAITRALLQHRATVDAQDEIGYTALTYAVEFGDETSVQLLLDSGASVNRKDGRGRTLSQTVKTRYRPTSDAILRLLAAHGMQE